MSTNANKPEPLTQLLPEADTAARTPAFSVDTPPSVSDPVVATDERPTMQGRPISSDPPGLLPRLFGHYQLVSRLGRGGMGVVYLARDVELDRLVAIKMLRSGAHADEAEIERFRREARAIARLDHPNIVPVHDVNTCEDQLYYVMAYVPGGSLEGHAVQIGQDVAKSVALMAKIAQAIGYAHDKGVLHRDLKPGNVLIDEDGEPLVSDFGLAKLAEDDVRLTQSGSILGTPPYMAPEQTQAQRQQLGPWTDVWALGVILYELLAGKRPFAGNSREEVFPRILHEEPLSLQGHRAEVDARLARIVQKCLEKMPADRYDSGEALATDLERWQRGEAPRIKPDSVARKALRITRRHYLLSSSTAALGLLGAGALGIWRTRDWSDPLRRIERRLRRGEPVTLVQEEQSLPPGAIWAIGPGTLAPMGPKDPLTLQAQLPGLLQLLPSSFLQAWRLEADILFQKPVNPDQDFDVGLYGGYVRYVVDDKPLHAFVATYFKEAWGDLPARVSLRVECWTRTGLEEGFYPGSTFKTLWAPIPEPRDWRHLSLTQTPDYVEAAFNGVSSGAVTRDYLNRKSQQLRLNRPQLGNVEIDYLPTQPVGILLRTAIASFRNVTLTPL